MYTEVMSVERGILFRKADPTCIFLVNCSNNQREKFPNLNFWLTKFGIRYILIIFFVLKVYCAFCYHCTHSTVQYSVHTVRRSTVYKQYSTVHCLYCTCIESRAPRGYPQQVILEYLQNSLQESSNISLE